MTPQIASWLLLSYLVGVLTKPFAELIVKCVVRAELWLLRRRLAEAQRTSFAESD